MGSLKHQSTNHFAGLDVSINDTSVCIVDDTACRPRRTRCCMCGGSSPTLWRGLGEARLAVDSDDVAVANVRR